MKHARHARTQRNFISNELRAKIDLLFYYVKFLIFFDMRLNTDSNIQPKSIYRFWYKKRLGFLVVNLKISYSYFLLLLDLSLDNLARASKPQSVNLA